MNFCCLVLFVSVVEVIVENEKLGIVLVISGDKDLLLACAHCEEFFLAVSDFVLVEDLATCDEFILHVFYYTSE